MPEYDVYMREARSTVSRTDAAAGPLRGQRAALVRAWGEAPKSLAHSSSVASALKGLFDDHVEKASRDVCNGVANALAGTTAALNTYVSGDGGMRVNSPVAQGVSSRRSFAGQPFAGSNPFAGRFAAR